MDHGTLEHTYQPGDRVYVLRDYGGRFDATVVGKSPKNTAEYEVRDVSGRIWVCHWASLRKATVQS